MQPFHPASSLAFSFILTAASFAPADAANAAEPSRPPNIVFIMADDLGYAEVGCYGQTKIRTPRIDGMAREGIRFTQFYSGSPVCAPARCVLLTGKHSGHAWIRNNAEVNAEVNPEGQRPIPAAEVTIAETLRQRGYATGCVGKWGLGFPGSEGDPVKQGFDLFFGYNCQRQAHNFYPRHLWRNETKVPLEGNDRGLTGKQYSHDLIEAEALEFIDAHRAGPFFLYVPFTIPHVALQVPEDSLAEYKGKWDDPPYESGRGYLPHPHPRAAYAAMVTRMDRSVGRILDRLKELKLDENTIVFFTSDNGPTHDAGGADSGFFESAKPFRGLKGSLYEGGVRVPLVVRWPGKIEAGRTSEHVAAFQDVFSTLCAIAAAEPPEGLDGISFMPTLLGKGEQPAHPHLYFEFHGYGGQQSVRLGNWKGIRRDLRKGLSELELYDLSRDVAESKNAAPHHPDVVARILEIMKTEHEPSELFRMPAIDGE
ncbi:MAG: arylsulfatase [Planctomycetales bacterium]